jgi:hypothetical protein
VNPCPVCGLSITGGTGHTLAFDPDLIEWWVICPLFTEFVLDKPMQAVRYEAAEA